MAKTTYCNDWFKEGELSFALSLSIGVSRFGDMVAFSVGTTMQESTKSLAFSFWFADIFVLLSTLCGLVTILLDQFVLNKSGYQRKTHKPKEIHLRDVKSFGLGFWLIAISIGAWYLSFNCFINISSKFAKDRFYFTKEQAGYIAVSVSSFIHV